MLWGSFNTQELEVLAILRGGGHKKCPPFKSGISESFTLSLRGPQKMSVQQFSHFVHPLPVINDWSPTTMSMYEA